jgi:hypothetical protein
MWTFANQLLAGQATASNGLCHLDKMRRARYLAVVEAEYLFIEIAKQMIHNYHIEVSDLRR